VVSAGRSRGVDAFRSERVAQDLGPHRQCRPQDQYFSMTFCLAMLRDCLKQIEYRDIDA
jgi:hypothetical protein